MRAAWGSLRGLVAMRHAQRLERLQRRLDAQRRPQDDAERRERELLDAMTDDELARSLAALEQVVELLREWGADVATGDAAEL